LHSKGILALVVARLTLALALLACILSGDPTVLARTVLQPQLRASAYIGETDELAPRAMPTPCVVVPTPCVVVPTPGVVVPTPVHPPADTPPTRIEAPSIQLDAPVVEIGWHPVDLGNGEVDNEWDVPDASAGYHKGSALPGHAGNTVISGHHNMGSQVFRYLVDLQIGDPVTLYVGDAAYHYRVAQREIVQEAGVSTEQQRENARWMAPTPEERLTLITCWPYSGNSHRLIVVALPIP
jgi:sortase A